MNDMSVSTEYNHSQSTCWKEFRPFIQNNGEEVQINISFIGLSLVMCYL